MREKRLFRSPKRSIADFVQFVKILDIGKYLKSKSYDWLWIIAIILINIRFQHISDIGFISNQLKNGYI